MVRPSLLSLALLAVLAPRGADARPSGLLHELTIYAGPEDTHLSAPEGVSCGEELIVTDTGNRRLLRYTLAGFTVRAVSEVKLPKLLRPSKLAPTKAGAIYVLDLGPRRLHRIEPSGAIAPVAISTEAGEAAVTAFALDAAERLYVYDARAAAVLELEGGAVVRSRALAGRSVRALVVDAKGRVYALDTLARTLYAAEPEEEAFGASPLSGVEFPVDLALVPGREDTLLLVDQNASALFWVGSTGVVLGRQLTLGTVEGLLQYPARACASPAGLVVVADRGNHRVQLFQMVR